jgi:hypothetical protein
MEIGIYATTHGQSCDLDGRGASKSRRSRRVGFVF